MLTTVFFTILWCWKVPDEILRKEIKAAILITVTLSVIVINAEIPFMLPSIFE